MNVLQIALTELKRMTSSKMRILALIALITIPSLYTGLYLYANQDPYGNMKNVPVAVVVEQNDDNYNAAGEQVADELLESGEFDFSLTDYTDAENGVQSEKYLFAIVVDSNFSKDVASISSAIKSTEGDFTTPISARITLITNDANSYLIHVAADTAGETISSAIKGEVTSEVADGFIQSLSTIHDDIQKAANGASEIDDGLKELNSRTPEFAAGLNQALTGSSGLTDGLNQLYRSVETLPGLTNQLAQGASQVAAGDAKLADVSDQVVGELNYIYGRLEVEIKPELLQIIDQLGNYPALIPLQQALTGALTAIDGNITDLNTLANGIGSQINELAGGAQQVSGGASQLADAMPALVTGIDQLRLGSNQLTVGLQTLSTSFAEVQNALLQLQSGSSLLANSLELGYKQIPNLTDGQRSASVDVIANPVVVSTKAQATAGGYAQGLMPFFIALSAWVGAYALFIILKPLSNRALAARQNPVRVAIGGWLTPTLVGVFQMALLFVTVVFALGMPPAHWLLAIGFLALMTAAYTAILFCLVAALDKVGTFLGLVLLILQLTSSGGTFPWQTTPEFFHILHDFLPMGYAIDGLRHIFYGGGLDLVWIDAGVLGIYLFAGLAVGSVIALRQRTWSIKRLLPEI